MTLPSRFNVPVADIPASIVGSGTELTPPESYGFISGLEPDAQARGVGTLPGGLPIERTVQVPGRPKPQSILIGGIGVFYPGTTGYATEENSQLNDSLYNPKKPDLSEVAEGVATVAIGGSTDPAACGRCKPAFGTIDGVPGTPSLDIRLSQGENAARIDLVGVTLDVLGPHGIAGPTNLLNYLKTIPNFGNGTATAGVNLRSATMSATRSTASRPLHWTRPSTRTTRRSSPTRRQPRTMRTSRSTRRPIRVAVGSCPTAGWSRPMPAMD